MIRTHKVTHVYSRYKSLTSEIKIYFDVDLFSGINARLIVIICICLGFPNVGKSSIINTLKGIRACNAGVQRGLTK